MFDQTILDDIHARETARIDRVMAATSPAAVLARLEREEADYVQYVSGCQRSTLKQTHGKNGVPCLTAIVGLALALLVGCDATGLTVATDAPQDVPRAIAPQPAPVVPPPAPVPPPVAVPAPLPVPVPPQAAPVQPPLAPGALRTPQSASTTYSSPRRRAKSNWRDDNQGRAAVMARR
jgi:hypothetical protein